MADPNLPLLNVYEVDMDGAHRHLVCFLDPVLAGVVGISSRAVVGQFVPGPDESFDPETFELNPEFVEVFSQYMNDAAASSPEVVQEARDRPSGWLYLLDPRYTDDSDAAPPPGDLLGCFAVDDTGHVVPGSFQYNSNHLWFDPARGVSGVLSDRRFYDWLHPLASEKGQT
jgi:hypothetical protein